MAEAARPQLYTVPVGNDLADLLSESLLAAHGDDKAALADTLILLPSNRAIMALTAAFVRKSDGGLLLPQMIAVGDLALDEALGPMFDPIGSDGEAVPPAIGGVERELLLTRLVLQRRKEIAPVEAIRLARTLASAIDQLEVEGKTLHDVEQIEPGGELSHHWEGAIADFTAVTASYQAELAKCGLLNPPARRNLLLTRFANILAAGSFERPIIAAGVASTSPAVVRLLRAVALRAGGTVVWPHIDLEVDDEQWSLLGPVKNEGEVQAHAEESHPQYQMKAMLEQMGVSRKEIMIFNNAKSPPRAVDLVFSRAETTAFWRDLPTARKKMSNVRAMEAADTAEEALAIAIVIRQAIETPRKTVALVTPDRELALRVATQLRRWDIIVDDSAGQPLGLTPPAALLLELAAAVASRFSPTSLLAILKHPFVMAGETRLEWLERVRALDFKLRGPRVGFGLSAVDLILGDDQLAEWWHSVAEIISELDLQAVDSFRQLLDRLIDVASKLTNGKVWQGQAGRQLAKLLDEYRDAGIALFDGLDRTALPALLAQLLESEVLRPVYGSHSRVSIFGLLEARLQQADLVICGGLNEGTWPQLAQPDPWLPPRIRRELGLPGLERNIGLSAHDLASMLGASEVVLSRALRDRAGPTVASRFLLRLQALLGEGLKVEMNAIDWARHLDSAEEKKSVERPAPDPSPEQRKVRLSVTQLDTLKADPFSFYARNILNLPVLDPVDAPPSYAWRGTAVHDVLEQWSKQDGLHPEKLVARADAALRDGSLQPELRVLWYPRVSQALSFFAEETDRQKREEGRINVLAEQKGRIMLSGIELSGTADRIDQLGDGTLVIVDYKTGTSPTGTKVKAGYALQLGLIGLIAESGGYKGVSGTASRFEYWTTERQKKGNGHGIIASPASKEPSDKKIAADDFTQFARKQAEDAIAEFINGKKKFTAKLHPEYQNYADYDQLMRYQEWYGRQPLEPSDG